MWAVSRSCIYNCKCQWRRRPNAEKCTIRRCAKASVARGWCAMHHKRFTRWGSPHIVHIEPDWTEAEVKILMAAKLTSHKRYVLPVLIPMRASRRSRPSWAALRSRAAANAGKSSTSAAIAPAINGRSEGLWTAEEDEIVRAHMAPEGERVICVDVASRGERR